MHDTPKCAFTYNIRSFTLMLRRYPVGGVAVTQTDRCLIIVLFSVALLALRQTRDSASFKYNIPGVMEKLKVIGGIFRIFP